MSNEKVRSFVFLSSILKGLYEVLEINKGNVNRLALLYMTNNNPITATERQRKVKFATTTTTTTTVKVHCGYKRRKLDPPNASESGIIEQRQYLRFEREEPAKLSPELEEAVLQLDEGCSECPSTGGGVSPLEDDGGSVNKSVLTSFKSHVACAI
ncbi:hypothetical protein LguiA_019896 [Lonicera macranthoides]